MAHFTGRRGGKGGETYPETGGGSGSGGAAVVPLTRQRFIDGGTTQTGLTGSAAEPFKTIAQFIAKRANVSVADASANFVGWIMPSLNGYTEDVSFPPYASTELRADSFAAGAGIVITGNATWANVAGAHAASPSAFISMHNVSLTGTLSVTDDSGAPSSAVFFGGDEASGSGVTLEGGFDSHTTTKLQSVVFTNTSIGVGIDTGTASTSAVTFLLNSVCNGPIITKSLLAEDSSISGSLITVNASNPAEFLGCTFPPGSNTVLTAAGGATFDGPSWRSFVEGGGTRAAGTIVLVVGGYNGGAVEGAALPTTAGPTNVSLNGTGATAGFTGEHSGNHYSSASLGADSVVKLLTGGGELPGDTILITKTDLAAHTLTVQNSAAATIGVIPSGGRGFILAQFNGTDWVFAEGGSLAA